MIRRSCSSCGEEFLTVFSRKHICDSCCSNGLTAADNRKCYLYLLSAEGRLKIGITSSVRERLNQLKSVTPFPIKLERVFAIGSGSRSEALEAEKSLHRWFQSSRSFVDGDFQGWTEWFNVTLGDAEKCIYALGDVTQCEQFLNLREAHDSGTDHLELVCNAVRKLAPDGDYMSLVKRINKLSSERLDCIKLLLA